LYSTQIRDEGVECLAGILKQSNWKAIRIHDRRLYSLDLTDNLIDGEGVKFLYELFYDQFRTTGTVFEMEAPLPTSIRILVLDYNLISRSGADWLGKILDVSRQLKVLSLERCGLEGRDLEAFCKAIGKNKILKALNLG
jgi:Ran GTPase-activating protein (RanGAP) involved in mRNA processing and transport